MTEKQKLEREAILWIFAACFTPLFVAVILLCFHVFLPPSAPKHAPRHAPQTDTAIQKTTRTTELLQLQLSKEQVESSSFEGRTDGSVLGNVGYVQGSSEGKPVTYIYLRYRAENGDIIDRLIPRDQVRLRDDLAPNAPATVEINVVKKREASYEDIQKDPSLCYDAHYEFIRDNLPAEECGKHPGDTPDEWQLDSETPTVVHVPKNSVIVTINPNMVPDGAKK
jgi:hypothetical protein